MNWLMWRQHRKQYIIFGVLLTMFAAFALFTGMYFWDTYQQALANCTTTESCGTLKDTLFKNDQFVFKAVAFISLSIPFLLGIFLGAPLLSKEYEEGTNKLIWTQSVSRRKWLTTKLAWTLLFAALYGLIMTLLVTWWSQTGNALYQYRFSPLQFDIQGYMPVAYALFATALGIMIGALCKRVMLALAITLAALVVLQTGVAFLARPHYVAPVTVDTPLATGSESADFPDDSSWVLYRSLVDDKGVAYEALTPSNIPEDCKNAGGQANLSNCLNSKGFHESVKYQPAYRYWNFQRIEAAIYLGLSIIFVAVTYRLVLKRDA